MERLRKYGERSLVFSFISSFYFGEGKAKVLGEKQKASNFLNRDLLFILV